MPGILRRGHEHEAVGKVASVSKKALSIAIQYQDTAAYARMGGDPPPQLTHAHNDPEVLKALLIRAFAYCILCYLSVRVTLIDAMTFCVLGVYGYMEEDIEILMDDGKHTSPTRHNIV